MSGGAQITLLIVILAVVFVVVVLTVTLVLLRRVRFAQIRSCTADDIPPTFGGSVADLLQEGYLVASTLRIVNKGVPDVFVILLYNVERAAYARLWVNPNSPPLCSLVSRLPTGELLTATDLPVSIDPEELAQTFPDATIAELVGYHTTSQAYLHSRGIELQPVSAEAAEPAFRESWSRSVRLTREMGPRLTFEVVARTVVHRPKHTGLLAEQPDIDRRLERLGYSPSSA